MSGHDTRSFRLDYGSKSVLDETLAAKTAGTSITATLPELQGEDDVGRAKDGAVDKHGGPWRLTTRRFSGGAERCPLEARVRRHIA